MLKQAKDLLLSALSPSQARRLRRIARPSLFTAVLSTEPLSRRWGKDRGTPIDRYYIESFLAAHTRHIRGRVLEVKDNAYTHRFGSGVTEAVALDLDPGNKKAAIIADLAAEDGLPSNCFDCFILAQTIQFVSDPQAAVRNAYRLLRPGGVVLATVPCISKLAKGPGEPDRWRLTPLSCEEMFGAVFGIEHTEVSAYGNMLAAAGFLAGIAAEELAPRRLKHYDPEYPLIVAIFARKK